MRVLVKPWFATVVLVVALGMWGLTVSPWGRWHTRQVVSQRIVAGTQHVDALSSPFTLNGGPSTLTFTARDVIADVRWAFVRAGGHGPAGPRGGTTLMPPGIAIHQTRLDERTDRGPRGTFRLRLSAESSPPRTLITATVTETRGYVAGVPVFWGILFAGVAYIGLAILLLRRQYPPNPLVIAQHREYR
jgi:hypothetical protein